MKKKVNSVLVHMHNILLLVCVMCMCVNFYRVFLARIYSKILIKKVKIVYV